MKKGNVTKAVKCHWSSKLLTNKHGIILKKNHHFATWH